MKADFDLLTPCAVWAGQHALALFFVLLALLLAASALCWWALRRADLPRRPNVQFLGCALGQRMAVGLAIMLTGIGVFAALAGQLGAQGGLSRADQALTDALRTSLAPLALQFFAVFTHLGDTATLTVLCIAIAMALLASGRRGLSLGWVVALAGNGLLNQTLKQIFSRVRPLEPEGSVLVPGFSFPSGHSSGAVVAYGMLAYLALRLLPTRWQLPALLAALVLAFTVGASRLFLRVHFASDVMAGFASGAAWLALCVMAIELTRCWRQRTL